MTELKRYSEAFKLHIVEEIESGRFRTQREAMEYFGITGYGTISIWLRKYGRNHLAPRIVRIETMEEKDKLQELKKRIKALEKALADTRVDQILAEAYFETFCEEFGVTDIPALKKKLDARRLKKQ
jgi:transposase